MVRILVLVLVLVVGSMLPLAPGGGAFAQSIVYINTATVEELDSLPGIGPSKAAAIVAARNRRPFRRLNDLLRVPGIGRATLERLAPFLRFEAAGANAPVPLPAPAR